MTSNPSALSQGLVRCHECGQVVQISLVNKPCPVCQSQLHARTPHSLQRTTAYLLSSYILYIPANVFPIMNVTQRRKVRIISTFEEGARYTSANQP